MREIEIKARLAKPDAIRAALKQKDITLSDPVMHHDRVWGIAGVVGQSNTEPWLRIRGETKGSDTRYMFTFKRSVTGQLDSIEHETEIRDPDEMASIIEQLNFSLYVDLTKTRRKARIGDMELCLDSVDELGDFIELEKLTNDDADYHAVAEELWATLEGLGVSRSDAVTEGYDTLINKERGSTWV